MLDVLTATIPFKTAGAGEAGSVVMVMSVLRDERFQKAKALSPWVGVGAGRTGK